jgi:antitoxin CcdA
MRLADYLRVNGMSQSELARRCGVSQQAVAKWANGLRVPRAAQMAALVQATGGHVSAADFFAQPRADLPADAGGFAERQSSCAVEARTLGLDPNAIAPQALRDAVRTEKVRRWQQENREAIEAWNRWTDENELPLARYRLF